MFWFLPSTITGKGEYSSLTELEYLGSTNLRFTQISFLFSTAICRRSVPCFSWNARSFAQSISKRLVSVALMSGSLPLSKSVSYFFELWSFQKYIRAIQSIFTFPPTSYTLMNYCCSSVLSIFDLIHIIPICRLLYFQLGVMTKHLTIGPMGNREFSFPSVLKVSPCVSSLTLSQIRTSEAFK